MLALKPGPLLLDQPPPQGYNKKATLLYSTRKFNEAIAQCRTTLSLEPLHFGAASGMGLCYLQLGDYPKAVEAFETALGINPLLADIKRISAGLKRQMLERKEGREG
jgi:tetratricopeptide (TPR) repeat protein